VPLSQGDTHLLSLYISNNLDHHALAAATGLNLLDIEHWLNLPHIAPRIAAHKQAESDRDRAKARADIRSLLAASSDPAERRQLIAMLLRADSRWSPRPRATDRGTDRSSGPQRSPARSTPATPRDAHDEDSSNNQRMAQTAAHEADHANERASPAPQSPAPPPAGGPSAPAQHAPATPVGAGMRLNFIGGARPASPLPPDDNPDQLDDVEILGEDWDDEDDLDDSNLTDEEIDELEDQRLDAEFQAEYGHLTHEQLTTLVNQAVEQARREAIDDGLPERLAEYERTLGVLPPPMRQLLDELRAAPDSSNAPGPAG
jgi:hypothetical protein